MQKNTSFIVLGLGELLWDIYPDSKKLGGAPANFAYHAGQLGAEAYPVSCIGVDPLGREILKTLKARKISPKYIQTDKTHPTGTVTVTLDKEHKPHYIINKNVAWDNICFTEKLAKLALNADAVCFGSLCQRARTSRNTIKTILTIVPFDCLKVFDLNLRQKFYGKEVITESLKLSNILKLSDEELPVLAVLFKLAGTQEEQCRQLLEQFPIKLIALTCGGKGSLLVTAEYTSKHPGFPVKVADTVGAGDSFTAAMVMGLLNNRDLDSINERANRLAGYVCSKRGATPGIPGSLLKQIK